MKISRNILTLENMKVKVKTEQKNKFYLRVRPAYEKWMDISFKNIALVMACALAAILFYILIVVFLESREAIYKYGIDFLFTLGGIQ